MVAQSGEGDSEDQYLIRLQADWSGRDRGRPTRTSLSLSAMLTTNIIAQSKVKYIEVIGKNCRDQKVVCRNFFQATNNIFTRPT